MTATETIIGAMSREEYDGIQALSNSGMKDLAVSPLRYWYLHINPAPKPEEEEETKAQRMGSALHCAVLESNETFDARYARALDPSDWPVCLDTVPQIRQWVEDNGGKAKGTNKPDVIASALEHMAKIGKHVPILAEEQRRFFAQNEGKTILQPDEWERLAGMARAVIEEPALKPILEKGKAEQSIVVRDPETGVMLKSRLDWMAPKFTLDLKSFSARRGKSIDETIHRAIYDEKYWMQGYFYDYVRRLATGEKQGSFDTVFPFVESDQPHETRIRRFLPKIGGEVNMYWESARIETRRLIRLYADCLAKFGDSPWRTNQEIESLTDQDVPQFAFRSM